MMKQRRGFMALHLGENSHILYSRITIVHFQVNVFSLKFTKRATVTQTESNPEVNKMTDYHAAEYSKTVCLDVK